MEIRLRVTCSDREVLILGHLYKKEYVITSTEIIGGNIRVYVPPVSGAGRDKPPVGFLRRPREMIPVLCEKQDAAMYSLLCKSV